MQAFKTKLNGHSYLKIEKAQGVKQLWRLSTGLKYSEWIHAKQEKSEQPLSVSHGSPTQDRIDLQPSLYSFTKTRLITFSLVDHATQRMLQTGHYPLTSND